MYKASSKLTTPSITSDSGILILADTIKAYSKLAKPGIIMGNGITTLAGFFLAAKGNIHVALLLATFTGVSLGIASACVFNNCIDRGIDSVMKRTRSRALVTGIVSPRDAIIFAVLMGIVGLTILGVFTNALTLFAEIVGIVVYVGVYSTSKRFSDWSTVLGSISGAIPPIAGYTAVTGRIDTTVIFLFLLLVFWQMPHFYAIAIYRLDDYQAARIPILPATKGVFVTKVHMILYAIGFAVVSTIFFSTEFTGKVPSSLAAIISLIWIIYIAFGFSTRDNRLWARQVFLFSLLVNVFLCIAIITMSFV
jgi:heme o synthase